MKRGCFLTIGVGVILVMAGAIWWLQMNADPAVTIPQPPAAPVPNAFGDFLAATKLEVDKDDVDDAISTHPDKARTLAEKQALLAANGPCLTKLKEGLAEPYLSPPIRSYSTLMPYLSGFRALARLLRFEGQIEAAHGDWHGALESDMDAIRLGEKLPAGGVIIDRLVGMACDAIGRKDLWGEIDHIS
ncbi:MAG TPA: hypothetical protein VE986_07325, partial [Hyphomicrobiales bacterium]|nr:hypothetical protein [Hyphomicrobiales bacterium]